MRALYNKNEILGQAQNDSVDEIPGQARNDVVDNDGQTRNGSVDEIADQVQNDNVERLYVKPAMILEINSILSHFCFEM